MSTQHTPGPWRFSGLSKHVITAENGKRIIATIGKGSTHPVTEDQNTANARLIAAAPELFTELDSLFSDVINTPILDSCRDWDEPLARVSKLLRKVKGEE